MNRQNTKGFTESVKIEILFFKEFAEKKDQGFSRLLCVF